MRLTIKTEVLSIHEIQKAADFLLQHKNVAFPTETVYGLGAILSSEEAIQQIFITKGRPQDNPLIVHLSAIDQVNQLAIDIPEEFYTLTKAFFPGPLTLILKKHPSVPSIISANLNTIAIRMPSHPIARQLIELVGQPLVAPSANLSGKPSSTSYQHVLDDFDGKIAAVIADKPTEIGIESTVVSLLNHRIEILRPGAISQQQIEEVLKQQINTSSISKEGHYLSPGMRYKHYAPNANVKLFYDKTSIINYCNKHPSIKRIVLSNEQIVNEKSLQISSKTLYAHLRLADDLKCDEVIIFCDNNILENAALMNRLLKASSKI